MDNKNCCGCGICGDGKIKTWFLVLVIVVAVFFAVKAIKELKALGFVGKELSPSATIMVSGEGEALTKPDIASFSFTVEKESLNVAEAQSGSAKIVNDILAELKKLGVDDKDVKTLGYNIYPRYEYVSGGMSYEYYPPNGGKRELAAYVVSQTIEVKVRKIADAGKIISSIGEMGATNLSGLSFSVDKEEIFTAEARKKAIDEMNLAIETAATIGARIVIVHSGNMLTNSLDGFEKNRRIETCIQSLKIISETAKKKNVRLALENLLGGMVAGEAWQLEQIVGALDKDVVGVCVDVSHASLCKELDKLLKTFAGRVIAVHISDNHGKMDDHLIPGEGMLDFVKIARKLKEINYKGVFTLEVLGEAVKRKPEEVLKASKQIALKIMKQAGV